MRTPTIPWEVEKDKLLEFKYQRKFSLTEINEYLFATYGKSVTNARLSQVFTKWANEQKPAEDGFGDSINAN